LGKNITNAVKNIIVKTIGLFFIMLFLRKVSFVKYCHTERQNDAKIQ